MESQSTHLIYDHGPIWLQHIFVSIVGYHNRRVRFGPVFERQLRFFEESQWWPRADLEAFQDEQVREIVRVAYEYVPFYRRMFDALGLKPADIRSRADLWKIPILDKETVYQHRNDVLSTAFDRRTLIRGRTSGATGTALPLWVDPEGWQTEYAFAWRLYQQADVRLLDPYATFNARLVVRIAQKRPPYWRYNYAGRQTIFSIYHVSDGTIESYIQELRRYPRVYWQGYPSFIYLIASHLLEAGEHLPEPPKAIFTSSETLLAYQRDVIQSAVGSPIYDRYGNSELCASMSQCEHGRYHVDMEYGVVEIEPLEEDELRVRGQLICTGFVNKAMPLIRYRIGDVVTILKSPCSCGRQSTVVESIDGRAEDYVVTPEGRSIGRLDHIFKDLIHIKESQILQRSPDAITVRIVRRPSYDAAAERELLAETRKRLGPSIRIDIEYVSEIPRSRSGKFRAVVSELSRSQILRGTNQQGPA